MKSPYWNVVVRGSREATVNGVPVDMVVPTNVYSSVFQHLAGIARQLGRPVLARGIDETQGNQVAWFTVDANGQAVATPPETGSQPTPQPHPGADVPPAAPGSSAPGNDWDQQAPLGVGIWEEPAPRHAPSPQVYGDDTVRTTAPRPPQPPAQNTLRQETRAAEFLDSTTVVRQRAPEPTQSHVVPVPVNAPPPPQGPAVVPVPDWGPPPVQPVSQIVPPQTTAQPPAEVFPGPQAQPAAPGPAVLFVQPPKAVPQGGFRGAMYRLTAGRVNFGPSQAQLRVAERDARISRPLTRPYSTAFLSFKGGIGKTSTTVGVGLTLAQMRGAPPIAIDANPDSGDLAERLLGEEELLRIHPRSITDLVRDIPQVRTWTDLTGYIMQIDRLHVLAGEQDPAVSDSLTAEGYTRIHDLVRHFFSVILTDCGTGVTHNAMSGILAKADNVVIAAGYAVSGAKRAASTLDWLAQHGYARLAQEALVVLTDKDGVSARVQKDTVRGHLATHSRQVFVVPNDPAVADGDRINLARVHPRTREAWAEVAAAVIDGYR